MSYTESTSQMRRHYPREVDGAKNEWKALIDHFTEAGKKSAEVEGTYIRAKAELQKQTLEQQQRMADDSRKRNRQQELDLERQLIDKDHMMYNRERVQQLEARQHKTNSFINSNNELLELKRTQLQRDKEANLQQDLHLLELERQSKDVNAIRALERMEKTKKVLEENNRLSLANMQMGDHFNQANQKNRMIDGNYGKEGDIFDSMFERQDHWRKFYGNIVHNHQIDNIGKHENNFLQRELIKSVSMKGLVDHRIVQKDRVQEENVQKRVLDQYNRVNQHQQETANTYKNLQEKRELEKEARKMVMRENGEYRLKEIEEEKMKQLSKVASRRDEQAKYRDVLDIQVLADDLAS